MKNLLMKQTLLVLAACILTACGGGGSGAVSSGEAHVEFSPSGVRSIVIDKNVNGGGTTAARWMTTLADSTPGLTVPVVGAYAATYPTVGFTYDPNGFSYKDAAGKTIPGILTLRWKEASGVAYTQDYDPNGGSVGGYGSINTIQQDFTILMTQKAPVATPAVTAP